MKLTPTPGSVAGRRIDRVGDPLEGLVNLFDLSLVLAVGLLLAALSSAGAVGLISGGQSGGGTPINGEPGGSGKSSGKGQEVGKVYKMQDGTYVFAPSGEVKSGGATGATGASGATGTGATGSSGASPAPSSTTGAVPQTGGLGTGGLGTGGGTTVR